MPRITSSVLVALLVLLLTSTLTGQTTWTGTASTAWNTAANWSAGVPTAATAAIIAPAVNQPTTNGVAGAACSALTVQAGATLTAPVTFPLAVAGNISCAGSVVGQLRMTGSGSVATTGAGLIGALTLVTGTHSITGASLGSLQQLAGAGVLTVQSCHTTGDCDLRGAGLTGGAASLLECEGVLQMLCTSPVTAPPTTIRSFQYWTSNANWQPASGTVIFTGQGTTVVPAAGTTWHDVETESQFGTIWQGNLVVAGALRMRGDVTVQGGTLVDLTQRATLTVDAALDGTSVTQLRIRNGLISAGVINLPNATLDADGDLTFFLSATMLLNGGTHHISNSFGMPGTLTMPASATIDFDGAGVITIGPATTLPNVRVSGTYTIRSAHIGGTLLHAPGAGTLAIQQCTVDGACTLQGSAVVDSLNGLLDANGNLNWQTTAVVNTPPATIRCAGSWNSNGNFQPTSGLVEFDGIGPKLVVTPAFTWRNLRIAAPTQVSTTLPVLTTGILDVAGQLSTTGNDVESFGALTVGGGLNANASLRIRAHAGMTVSGIVQAAGARLDVDGTLTVSGTVNVNAGPHALSGSVAVTGALSIPAGNLTSFDGSGTIDIVASSPIPQVAFTGTSYDVQSLVVSQDLLQSSGTLAVRSCLVQRDATFQGQNITDLAGGLLNVRRHVVLQLTAAVAAPPATIRCGGNWTSTATFAPLAGLVQLDGAGAQSISAPATTWFDLRIAAGAQPALPQNLNALGFVTVDGQFTVTGSSLQVGGNLAVGPTGLLAATGVTAMSVGGQTDVDGTLGAPLATLAAIGDVRVAGSGAAALGAGPHTFQGGLDVAGSLAVPGTADFHFNGQGVVAVVASNVLPTVLFANGPYKIIALTVQNLIRHTGGRLTVNQLTGLQNAQFQGLTVEGAAGDLIDIAGNITFGTSNVVVTPPGTIRCGGQWSSNPQFLPTSGRIEMVGASPQTMTSAQLFLGSLDVGPGANVNFSCADVILQGDLTLSGGLVAPTNVLEVRGSMLVSSTGTLVQPAGSACTVADSVANTGSIGSPVGGVLRMVGSGVVAGNGSFGNVAIASTGEVQLLGAMTFGGTLTLSAGTMRLGTSANVVVVGTFLGAGGVLRGPASAVLDCNGAVVLVQVQAHPTGVPDLRCFGSFSSDAAFVPTTGTVFLDGPGALVSLSGTQTFAHLVVAAGNRTVATNVNATALDVVVQAGASLLVGARTLQLNAATVQLNGNLDVGSGGALVLGPLAALTVGGTGRLSLVGTLANRARLDGPPGGGYAVTVNGTIEAVNYSCAHMGPGGLFVTAAATIAPAPRDLRGGVFASGDAAPGSCLLHIDRSAPAQLRYVRFDDAGTVTFNVNSTGTAQVGIVNDDGNFTGPAHESDPGAKIDWLPPEHTLVSAYTSSAAVHRTEIRVATTNEFDVQQFHVLRSESASGPFAEIVGSPFPPTGSPVLGANYSKTDFATVDTTKYFYRLEEELTHGLRRVLADDFARPWPQQVANAWFVGTNGGYPDIATAVAAAPPGASILVQAGTYPSFTLNKSVRIAPDGSGPVVIDTTLAKMVIRDIAVGAPDLGLYDVSVGSPTSPFGMEIVNCDNIIVLDGLQVAAGTGVVGLLVDDSRQVALQNCTITGDPGLKFDNNALAYLSRGSVDELVLAGLSDVTRCGVVPTTQQVGVGSVVHALTGTMPNVSSRAAWPGDKPVSLTITTDPNSFYALFYSFGRDFFDLGAVFPSLDMALLIEQTQAQMLTFNLSVSGTEQIVLPAPSNPFSWGLAIPYQVFDLKQPSNLGRAGNSRAAFLLP